jgi:hypothetical protein
MWLREAEGEVEGNEKTVASLAIMVILFKKIFWWHWALNSGLTLARQAFYTLSHSTSPVLCWIFLR